jgi:hypothetical protein
MNAISRGRGHSAWSRARSLAEQTPKHRNRYVDLLRALSIGLVVLGHWLIAAPWVDAGRLRLDHMLAVQPWTQWLTWLFQVMPIFFMVGGYSNGASWAAALRSETRYRTWIAGRLQRLVGPMLPLLGFWAVSASIARLAGVPPGMIRVGSQVALVPLWFLAVYIVVVLLAPWTHAAWRRYGMASFWVPAAVAVVVDLARFGGGMTGPGWSNYLFVWIAVHQLGYAWCDGRIGGLSRSLPWGLAGGAALLAMVTLGPYPLSMVGVPGDQISNTLPPSLAMLVLGILQAGLLLSLERPASRLLAGPTMWTATVLVNGTIMSVYLWHSTTMIASIGLANLAGGVGLAPVPGSGVWWASRPVWLLLQLVLLLLVLPLVGRFERRPVPPAGAEPAAWRSIAGALAVCTGLAILALGGIGAENILGLRWGPLLTVAVGACILGIFSRSGRS